MVIKLFIAFALVAAVSADVSHLFSNNNNLQEDGYHYKQPSVPFVADIPVVRESAPAPVYTDAFQSFNGGNSIEETEQYETAPAPVYRAPAPAYNAPAPVYKAPAPVYKAPAPVYNAPAPVSRAPAPVYKAPAPVYNAPAPVYNAPAPKQSYQAGALKEDGYHYEAPRVAFETNTVSKTVVAPKPIEKEYLPPVQQQTSRPRPVVTPAYKAPVPTPAYKAPAPVYKAPAPVYKAPAPVYNAPAPVQKAPAPVYKAPAPVYKAPAPVYNAPAPVYKAPAPVYKAPAPVYKAPAPVYKAPAPVYNAPAPTQSYQAGALKEDGYHYEAPRVVFETNTVAKTVVAPKPIEKEYLPPVRKETPRPVVTPAPAVYRPQPVVTPAPAVYKPRPVVTAAPVVHKPQPIVKEYLPPVQKQTPVVYKPKPVVTPAPAVYRPQPVVTAAPAVYRPQPVVTAAPAVYKPAATNIANEYLPPVQKQAPAPKPRPVAPKPVIPKPDYLPPVQKSWLSFPIVFVVLQLALHAHLAHADVSQLVRSGNGFVYDVPKVSELQLEVDNEFPTGDEFPQDAIPVAPSDVELGVTHEASTSNGKTSSSTSSKHGYKYQVPSRRFKS
ncbi:extensin-2-like [Scaptodrosophila lebanonensis]|uniref:Extensin-2-like n=1 Tax=Drosophila lebanonensis TaxID=7225 RepID=A0A6J2TAI0_DROLE|nr:extensin-2-like [Scaptodrosophila lebanonensis]